jgi:hypothetical protein
VLNSFIVNLDFPNGNVVLQVLTPALLGATIGLVLTALVAVASDDAPLFIVRQSGGNATTLDRAAGTFATPAPNLTDDEPTHLQAGDNAAGMARSATSASRPAQRHDRSLRPARRDSGTTSVPDPHQCTPSIAHGPIQAPQSVEDPEMSPAIALSNHRKHWLQGQCTAFSRQTPPIPLRTERLAAGYVLLGFAMAEPESSRWRRCSQHRW